MNEEVEKLVLSAKKGCKTAYGKIYEIYIKKIYRYVYFMVYSKELAEDITQNAFIKAWISLPGFDQKRGTFQSYLYAIARNLVFDFQRKRKEISLEVIADILPSNEDLEEIVNQSMVKEITQKALSTLEDEEKEIVVLRYFEEMSYAEIGKILGKGEGAVRVRLHRILKKLKAYLKENNYEN